MKTLGIDLGTNSLGWAILDDTKPGESQITDSGVVVFEEGIKREKGRDSLETPAAERRKHRMARRLKFRRRLRKFKILEILIDEGMCPLTHDELEAWKQKDQFPLQNKAFLKWLKSDRADNPYADRAAAASGKVAPDVLGRALYHLAQRRGFKSSRKDARNEKEEEKQKQQDERQVVKSSIAAISAILKEKNCTLGQHFHDLYQKGEKVRGCYTGRKEHYEKEFDAIAAAQGLDEKLAARIRGVLFFQRPLRPQTHLIGKCPLEPSLSRCQISHPDFEAYRMWSFINNIRIITDDGGRIPLTPEQRETVARAFFKTARNIPFSDIVKKIKLPKGDRFNYKPKQSVATCSVTHRLNEILGTDSATWTRRHTRPDGKTVTYDRHTIFDALIFFDDDEKLAAFAKTKLGFSDDQAAALCKIPCPDGYAQYSLGAIRRINVFLEKGVELSQAVFLAKLPDIMGAEIFATNEPEILSGIQDCIETYRQSLRDRDTSSKKSVIPLKDLLHGYLKSRWNLTDDQLARLYYRDSLADTAYAGIPQSDTIPPVNLGMLRNPLVQRTLTILRKQVNFLRKSGRIDADTRIHIELARSVNNRNTRMAFAEWQKSREEQRANARKRLVELGLTQNPTDTDILRYILWEEQGQRCLYTGDTISATSLLSDAWQIEHTIPRSRSGDNSQVNLTLCSRDYNCNRKKGRLPVECDNYDEIAVCIRPWQETVEQLENTYHNQQKTARNTPQDNPEMRAKNRQKALATRMELDYWRDKVRTFTLPAEKLTDSFLNRQLVDTGIITRHAVALLRSTYPKTYPVNGTAVAWARHGWGIQDIREKKARDTHLHHAVDAMVIAGLNRDRFNQICAFCKDDGDKDYDALFPEHLHPFPGFAQAVFNASESILVRHLARQTAMKQTRRKAVRLAKARRLDNGTVLRKVPARGDTVRGQLHKETFYGCIHNPNQGGSKTFVSRKPLNSSAFESQANLQNIVDPAIRDIVTSEIQRRMDAGTPFKKAIDDGNFQMPSGVPIKKVRVIEKTVKTPLQIRQQLFTSKHDYKNPVYATSGEGSNIRLALFKKEVKGKIRYAYLGDSLMEWARRSPGESEPHGRTDMGEFIGYVYPGQMALTYQGEPVELMDLRPSQHKNRLYKVVKFNAQDGRITFIHHAIAHAMTDLGTRLKAKGKNAAGESKIDTNSPHELLLVSPSTYLSQVLFEGIHFKMDLAGKINFLL